MKVFLSVLAAGALVGLLTFGLLSKGGSQVKAGETAPAMTLPNLGHPGHGSIDDYRGRWVLVNFWASWCEPCREEAPALEKFQREHGGSRFTIVGIDTQDISDDGRAFVRQYGLSYPQLHDGNGDFERAYGDIGVPDNYLIEPDGKVNAVWLGPVDEKMLDDEVAPALPAGADES